MIIGKEECGCEVHQDSDARVEIVYCPKHKATDDMYEALKYFYDHVLSFIENCTDTDMLMVAGWFSPQDKEHITDVIKALAKAEGLS